jgi:hypothetical protein
MYIANLLNSIVNPKAYATPYENSLKYVFFIPCIISIYYAYVLNRYDILIIFFFVSSLAIEPLLPYVKNDGIYKMVFRFICCAEYIGILYLMHKLHKNISTGVKKILLYAIGYLLTSCIFQCIIMEKNEESEENEENKVENREDSRMIPEVSRILPEIPPISLAVPSNISPDLSPNNSINSSETRVLENTIDKSGNNSVENMENNSSNSGSNTLEISRDIPVNSAQNIPQISPRISSTNIPQISPRIPPLNTAQISPRISSTNIPQISPRIPPLNTAQISPRISS